MSEETRESYDSGEIVWVKLGSCWWPGEVKNSEELPSEVLDFKKPPLVIVKFFDEDSYEYVKAWTNIYPYNCGRKNEFIRKGMVAFRAKVPHMENFPKDVLKAEEKLGGNPNILSDPMFLPKQKRNVAAEVFGTPSPKNPPKNKRRSNANKSGRKKETSHITHRRFLGVDDYQAYICIQYPGKDRTPGDKEDDEVIRINTEPEQDFNCHSCSFSTKRLEVMILHTKSHIQGVYLSSTRKSKQLATRRRKEKSKKPRGSDVVDSDSSSSQSEPVKQKKRKPKVQGATKTKVKKTLEEPPPKKDIRSELLGAWEDSDEEELDDSLCNMNDSLSTVEKSSKVDDMSSETVPELTLDNSTKKSDKNDPEIDKPHDSEVKSPERLIEEALNDVSGETDEASASKEPLKSLEEHLSTEKLLSTLEGDSMDADNEAEKEGECLEKNDSATGKETDEANKDQDLSPQKMGKEMHEAIKSCFDFDEDDEDDNAIVSKATSGRKIPRVIPKVSRKVSASSDVARKDQDEDEADAPAASKEKEKDEDDDAAFKELMELTAVPSLPDVQNTLKCEQNFHNVKTIKFPDKAGQVGSPPKAEKKEATEVATKLTNPKKRFVKSFEDFELMQNEIRRREEEQMEASKNEKSDSGADAEEAKMESTSNKFDYLDDSDEQSSPESNIKLSKLKSKIMSKIIEEARINTESRNKIMAKIQDSKSKTAEPPKPLESDTKSTPEPDKPKPEKASSSHRTPRSKILESYRKDNSKHRTVEKEETSKPEMIESSTEETIRDRLNDKQPERDIAPPKKGQWSRRGSHPKKDRKFFKLQETPTEGSDNRDRSKERIRDSELTHYEIDPIKDRSKINAIILGNLPTGEVIEGEELETPVKEMENLEVQSSEPLGVDQTNLATNKEDLAAEQSPVVIEGEVRDDDRPKEVEHPKDVDHFQVLDFPKEIHHPKEVDQSQNVDGLKVADYPDLHEEVDCSKDFHYTEKIVHPSEVNQSKEVHNPEDVVQRIEVDPPKVCQEDDVVCLLKVDHPKYVEGSEVVGAFEVEKVPKEVEAATEVEVVAQKDVSDLIEESDLIVSENVPRKLLEAESILHKIVVEPEIMSKPEVVAEAGVIFTPEVQPKAETVTRTETMIADVELSSGTQLEVEEIPLPSEEANGINESASELVEEVPLSGETVADAFSVNLEDIPLPPGEPPQFIQDNRCPLKEVAVGTTGGTLPTVPPKKSKKRKLSEDVAAASAKELPTDNFSHLEKRIKEGKIEDTVNATLKEFESVNEDKKVTVSEQTKDVLTQSGAVEPEKMEVIEQPQEIVVTNKMDMELGEKDKDLQLKSKNEGVKLSGKIEGDLSRKIEQSDVSEIIEEADLSERIEEPEVGEKTKEQDLSEKIEETEAGGMVEAKEMSGKIEATKVSSKMEEVEPGSKNEESGIGRKDKEPVTNEVVVDNEVVKETTASEVKPTEKPKDVTSVTELPSPTKDHANEVEIQCASSSIDSFKFSIQTNLSILSSREEMSALALATLSEMKAELESSEEIAANEQLPLFEHKIVPPALPESEMVTVEGNLTVVSEKDLADGQVEITSEQVISPKRPITLSTFSMDFSDSFSDSNSNSTTDTSCDLGKSDFNSKGTEFTAKALTKQMKKVDQKKESTFGRLELINILEGNSDTDKKLKEYPCPPKKTSVVDDYCDFEEHIPSQIVCAKALKKEVPVDEVWEPTEKEKPSKTSVMSTTSKLLERLTTESKAKAASAKNVGAVESPVSEAVAGKLVMKGQSLPSPAPKTARNTAKSKPNSGTNKPIILSEQIVKPATETVKSKPRKAMEDIEDMETAFVIRKEPNKTTVHEEAVKSKSATNKTSGKAKILQQTIITPAGEIIQPGTEPTTLDDNIFDINSMPIVLSDEILTPESIEKMPIVIGSDAKATVTEKVVKRPAPGRIVTTQATPKTVTVTKHKPPRILQTVGSKVVKNSPLLPNTAKPGKYIIVPQSSIPPTKYVPKKPAIVKKPVTPSSVPQKTSTATPEPSGNKIMIVTNQQGQQQRLLLTPAQQKMLGYQSQKVTKTIVKGNVMQKSVLAAKGLPLGEAGTSGVVPKPSPMIGQKIIVNTTVGQGLITTASGQVAGAPGRVTKAAMKRSPAPKVGGKTQKTILIKNQHGQTVRKIQGTDDELLDKQVAEQLKAIKASSGMKFNSLQKPAELERAGTKAPVRRSYSKRVEPKTRGPPPLANIQQTPKHEAVVNVPPLVKKSDPAEAKPSPSLPKEETKTQPPERPLNQLVIQDAVGNQTTITEGQILALPSETVDGQPQSYMLVTLDESGNLTPLNSEALMSLDPNLGLGGDLSNMVLQIDQSALTDRPQATIVKPPEVPAPLKPVEVETLPQVMSEAVRAPEIAAPAADQKIVPAAEASIQTVAASTNGDPGQQLIVTGDPIATQKFLESLTEGTTDLANILANAEGNSILIQADGQQILINTNTDNQMMLSMNNDGANAAESTEGGGNPIFSTQPSKNQDILAAALADTDVFQQEHPSSAPVKIGSQLSPSNALYPMNVGNVLETSLTLSSPIMTPLEVPSTNSKKIPDDEADILTRVPKNVDLPITITDPNISQTVANQQVSQMIANELQTNLELALPISESSMSAVSTEMNSPSFVYTLPALDDAVEMSQKPFNGSMPLLNEDVEETGNKAKEVGEQERADVEQSDDKNKDKDSTDGFLGEDEGRFTLGGEMCSSLSEPPPEMFDLPEANQHYSDKSGASVGSLRSTPDAKAYDSKDDDVTDPSQADSSNEGSCEIPLQPQIVAKSLELCGGLDSLKRSLGEAESESKRCRFD